MFSENRRDLCFWVQVSMCIIFISATTIVATHVLKQYVFMIIYTHIVKSYREQYVPERKRYTTGQKFGVRFWLHIILMVHFRHPTVTLQVQVNQLSLEY